MSEVPQGGTASGGEKSFMWTLEGYLAHKKTPTPLGPPRTLGIQGLLEIKDTHRHRTLQ